MHNIIQFQHEKSVEVIYTDVLDSRNALTKREKRMLVVFIIIYVAFVIGHVTLVILSYRLESLDGTEENRIVYLILSFYFGVIATQAGLFCSLMFKLKKQHNLEYHLNKRAFFLMFGISISSMAILASRIIVYYKIRNENASHYFEDFCRYLEKKMSPDHHHRHESNDIQHFIIMDKLFDTLSFNLELKILLLANAVILVKNPFDIL